MYDETAHTRKSRATGIVRSLQVFLLVLVVLAPTAAGATRRVEHVTLIGDSVADAIPGNGQAVAMLSQGIDLDFEVEACRRVDGEGCPGKNGVRPPSVVDLAKSMGSKLGDNVVVSVGYNDFEDQYAKNIETALAAFKAAGVKHVWWLTLRAAHHPYLNMNDDIEAAAAKHPELTVVDWNVYSRSHPDWFQDDGLHLLAGGSLGMATLIHQRLLAEGVAAKPVQVKTLRLPAAHLRKAYLARLTATSGVGPYRWSLLARAPKGFHLQPDGRIDGKPLVKPGSYVLNVRVKDNAGSFDSRRLTLRVVR